MKCQGSSGCSIRLEHVDKEMEYSLNHISRQKEISLNAVKIYLAVLSGLLAYAAFVQTKVINNVASTPPPSDNYFMYAVFGIMATFLVFFLGWILLDFITGVVFSTIMHYKHVSYMRSIKGDIFGKQFLDKCIVPISAKKISMKRSRHLPATFSIINLLLLCLNYYFFSCFLDNSHALTYTMGIIAFFAIYYPNVCAKYNEEITIAQRMRPTNNEEKIRGIVRSRIDKNKKGIVHKSIKVFLCIIFIMFFVFILYNIYILDVVRTQLPSWIFNLEIALLLSLAAVRYFIAQYRIRKFKFELSFKKNEA